MNGRGARVPAVSFRLEGNITMTFRILAAAAALIAAAAPAAAAPVLLISIDGLRPGDVIEAEKRGIKAPNLRRMMAEGAWAEGVTGVTPTITYPSHTTLLTGAAPARHGVVANTTFDPRGINQTGWYWYAEDIHRETLWDAARKAGLRTANIHWPVSVGAPVNANLPQIWRTGHDDDRKLLRALATPGLLPALEHECGVDYAQGIDESLEADRNRARFAAALIARDRPAFTTVYFASLDHVEHLHGPGSPEAHDTIAANDALVGDLTAAARKAMPDVTVVVVSDHGFQPVSTDINLFRALLDAGLIRLEAGKVKDWQATVWPMGGTAAIVLARPDDNALRDTVAALLDGLKANPANGIASIVDKAGIEALGAAPQASFLVNFREGFQTGGDPAAPLTRPSKYKGMHGYAAASPAMRASLFVSGPKLARRGSLGLVDMRAIAPSIANVLGVELPRKEVSPAF